MKFCMVVDLDNIYRCRMAMMMKMMMMMIMMMINIIMKIKIAITHPIFEVGARNFAL